MPKLFPGSETHSGVSDKDAVAAARPSRAVSPATSLDDHYSGGVPKQLCQQTGVSYTRSRIDRLTHASGEQEVMISAGRSLGTVLALGILVGLTPAVVSHFSLSDFIEYWTAAHLFVHKQNPYSLNAMMEQQRALGWNAPDPLMVMSPPQILPLLVPLGLLRSFALARVMWLWLSALILVLALMILSEVYGATEHEQRNVMFAAAFFFPVWLCFVLGQIAPLLLLGVAGFLWFERRGCLFMAGAALAVTTLKPHLFYLVWITVLLWAVEKREIRMLAGAGLSSCVAIVAALTVDGLVLSQYLALVQSSYIWAYLSGLGGLLRLILRGRHHFVQFAPMLPGLGALIWYWRGHRAHWIWRDNLPFVLTLSLLTAAYGWPFDELVLLLPIVMVAVRCTSDSKTRRTAVAWLLTISLASFAAVLVQGYAASMVICATAILVYLALHETAMHHKYKSVSGYAIT